MTGPLRFCLLTAASYFAATSIAWAGTITAHGAVAVLDDVNQMQNIIGTATYDEGGNGGVPLNQYTPQGMTFYTGPLTAILAGVNTLGNASQPDYQVGDLYFPAPIAGGGLAQNAYTFYGGVVKFSQPTTQFGLTASSNGTQYLIVWDENGVMLGQVTWEPDNDAAFIGIDTNGVPIGMAAYGNDNLWSGQAYSIVGSTIISDTWIWASGATCQADNDCTADDNECTNLPVCQDGLCLQAAQHNTPCTEDANVCTNDLCIHGECLHPAHNGPCDDGNACTENDVCNDIGVCDGTDVECNDSNLCTLDSCSSQIGCVSEWSPGCCITDGDCEEGYICHFATNTCIVDPGPTGDGDGDGDGEGDGDGDGDGDGEGDGDGDPTVGEDGGDGDGETTGGGESESDGGNDAVGEETGTPFDTFGAGSSDEGCNCSTEERNAGALFGLFGLALFAAVRRKRDPLSCTASFRRYRPRLPVVASSRHLE